MLAIYAQRMNLSMRYIIINIKIMDLLKHHTATEKYMTFIIYIKK